MSNGEVCCLVGVCCPAGSVAQREAWIDLIHKSRPTMPAEAVEAAADRVLDGFNMFADVVGLIDGPATPPAA